MSARHPPAPWRLAGPAIVVPLFVPVGRARALVPGDIQVVQLTPGHTLGALIAVTYQAGSTLTYSELAVAAATVRSGTRVGAWISHIWVDDEQSVAGGRSIWKLPKDLATFDVARGDGGAQRFAVRADDESLVRIAVARPRFRVRAPFSAPVPMISGGKGAHFFTLGRSGLAAGPARVRVEVPGESPLAALAFTPAAVGITGSAHLVMPAPHPA